MSLTQGRRALERASSDTLSPLHFVVGGGVQVPQRAARVEVLRGTPGTVLTGSAELDFSTDGLSWGPTAVVTALGVAFARYTPTEVITTDRVRVIRLYTSDGEYQAEALELAGQPTCSEFESTMLRNVPRAYRDASSAVVGVIKALAWATYPARLLIARNDALHDPGLMPAWLLEQSRALQGLPGMNGFPAATRRALLIAAADYYHRGGQTLQLQQLLEIFTGVRPDITGVGVYSVVLRLPGLPVDQAAFTRAVNWWMPAWVSWLAYYGSYYDSTVFYDGVGYYSGQFV